MPETIEEAPDETPDLRPLWLMVGLFLWQEIVAIFRLEFLPEKWRPAFAFAVRNWIACVVALYLAFIWEIDSPYWAASTVWLVAQPTLGMVVSRSIYRAVGTLIGGVVGLAMVGLLYQTPEAFIFTLALWIGACTVAANMLRNFRDYFVIMAGYSASLVALDSYGHPDQAFHIATARTAATLLGIACSALGAVLFAQQKAREKVITGLKKAIADTAQRAAFPATGTISQRIAIGRPLVSSLITLEREIDFAAAESANFRIHADLARSLLAHLFGGIAAKRALEDHLKRIGPIEDKSTGQIHEDAMRLLVDGLGEEAKWNDHSMSDIRTRIRESSPESTDTDRTQAVSSRIILDRLDDLLYHLGRAMLDWKGMRGGWRRFPSLRLDFHRDQRLAYINGMRAFLAVMVGGAFWVESAWPNGSTMLLRITMVCSLFSSAPRPDVRNAVYLQGVLTAAILGGFCNCYLFQQIDGFPLFALVLGLFLIPGAMAIPNPATAGFATAYCSYFLILSQPTNAMVYNASAYFNNAVASLTGVAFGVIIYRLVIPPNPQAARRYVVWRIRRGLRNLSQRTPIFPTWAWQSRMFDRVHRLSDPANPSATPTNEFYEGGLAALNLGNELLRLRHLIAEGKLCQEMLPMAQAIVKSFGRVEYEPESTFFTIQAVKASLHVTSPPATEEARLAWTRLTGIVQEMEAFFNGHHRFLTAGVD